MATIEERLAFLEQSNLRQPSFGANSIPASAVRGVNLQSISPYTGDLIINGNITMASPGRITDTLGNYWDYSTGFNWKQKIYPGTGSALNATKYLEYNVADGGLHANGSLFLDNNLYPGGGVVRSFGDNGTELTANGSLRVNSGDVIIPAGELYFDSLTNNTVTEVIKGKSASGPIGAIEILSDSAGSGKSTVFLQGTVTTLSSTQNTWRLGAGGGSESGSTGGVWYSYDTSGFSLPQIPLITYDGTRTNMWLPTRTYPNSNATRYITDNGTNITVSGGLELGGALYPSGQTVGFYSWDSGVGVNKITGSLMTTGAIGPSNQFTRTISDNGSQLQLNGNVLVTGAVYPSNQTSRYMADNGTVIGFVGNGSGGAAANWSAGWAAGAYFLMNVGGSTVRVPFFINA